MASDPDFHPVKPSRKPRPSPESRPSGDVRVSGLPAEGRSEPRGAREPRKPAGFPADAILFYGPRDGKYSFLSNFSSHSVFYMDKLWPTCEHAFQGAKFLRTDHAWAEKIRRAPKPGDAKKLGTSREHPIVEGWDDLRLEVMEEILRAKMEQHPALLVALLGTGTTLIGEDSPYDRFWGVGSDRTGTNHLGKIWMAIRSHPPTPVTQTRKVATETASPEEKAKVEKAARFRSMYACGAGAGAT